MCTWVEELIRLESAVEVNAAFGYTDIVTCPSTKPKWSCLVRITGYKHQCCKKCLKWDVPTASALWASEPGCGGRAGKTEDDQSLKKITTCTTTEGLGCVFPFTHTYSDFISQTFTSCTDVTSKHHEHGFHHWCPTKVDAYGERWDRHTCDPSRCIYDINPHKGQNVFAEGL